MLAGAIAGRADLVEAVRHTHNILGGVIDPHASYLLLRGMKTLQLRVERQVRGGWLGGGGGGKAAAVRWVWWWAWWQRL